MEGLCIDHEQQATERRHLARQFTWFQLGEGGGNGDHRSKSGPEIFRVGL